MGKRPESKFFLANAPQPGQAQGLYDQKKQDERTKNHELQVRNHGSGQCDAEPLRRLIQDQRQGGDEGGAQEAADDGPQSANVLTRIEN